MTHRLINKDRNDMYVFEVSSEARVAVGQYARTEHGYWVTSAPTDIVKAPLARRWYKQIKARGFVPYIQE